MVRFVLEKEEKEKIAEEILQGLPEWFGLPDSTREYIIKSKELPFWTYVDAQPQGFIVLRETGKYTAEVYVMGVRKDYHRKGIGSALFEAFESYAKEHGYEYLQVKTVQKGHYKEYDLTNAFYEKMGFRELECFPNLWDEWNPCQIYVKRVE